MRRIVVTTEELKNIETLSEEKKNKIRDELIPNSRETFINHYGITEEDYDKIAGYFGIIKENKE
jgi:hypothetical protein